MKYKISYTKTHGDLSVSLRRERPDGCTDRITAAVHTFTGEREELLDADQIDSQKKHQTSFHSPLLRQTGSVLHYRIINNDSGFDHLADYFKRIMDLSNACKDAPLSTDSHPNSEIRIIRNPSQEQVATIESLFKAFGFPSPTIEEIQTETNHTCPASEFGLFTPNSTIPMQYTEQKEVLSTVSEINPEAVPDQLLQVPGGPR